MGLETNTSMKALNVSIANFPHFISNHKPPLHKQQKNISSQHNAAVSLDSALVRIVWTLPSHAEIFRALRSAHSIPLFCGHRRASCFRLWDTSSPWRKASVVKAGENWCANRPCGNWQSACIFQHGDATLAVGSHMGSQK